MRQAFTLNYTLGLGGLGKQSVEQTGRTINRWNPHTSTCPAHIGAFPNSGSNGWKTCRTAHMFCGNLIKGHILFRETLGFLLPYP